MAGIGRVAIIGALLVTGCGKKEENKAADMLGKGQVVATVGGKDVTIHELNAELAGMQLPSGEQRKQIEQAALQSLVNRTILASIARERGLQDTPTYVLQRRRADETLLVQLLQRDIAAKVPVPSRDEAAKFIAANPDLFAQRKIFTVDQIQFPMPQDAAKLKAFEPMKTLDEIAQRLTEDGTEFRRAPAKLDTVGTQPEVIRQIAKLPEGEVFVVPQGQGVLANRITSVELKPFIDDDATNYAINLIRQRAIAAATEKALKTSIEKARAEVKYQGGYAPPKEPVAPKAAPQPART
jgi:peptidyl-prolyl cis-trans isomerase C